MSSLHYLAGAAVERNINEAIRLEEELNHGVEIQNLIHRFQVKLDELYDKNEELVRQINSMGAVLNHKDALIGQKNAEISRLNRTVEQNEKELLLKKAGIGEAFAESFFMENEVKNLIGSTLHEIIAEGFKKGGIEYNEDVAGYIKEQTELCLALSSDTMLRYSFIDEFGREIYNVLKSGKKYRGPMQLVDKAIEIAQRLNKEIEAKKAASSGGRSSVSAYSHRIPKSQLPDRILPPENN